MKNTIINPTPNLYDRIIVAVKREQETQKPKRLLIIFFSAFIISVVITSSFLIAFIKEFNASGASYVIKTIIADRGLFSVLWKHFFLAFVELMPVTSIFIFLLCLFATIFTLRLLVYKKYSLIKILLKYK